MFFFFPVRNTEMFDIITGIFKIENSIEGTFYIEEYLSICININNFLIIKM